RNLVGIWDDAVRGALRRSFASIAPSYGESASARKAASLDEYARKWTTAWTEACEATHLSRSQPESILQQRHACLKQRLFELKAVGELLQTARTIEEIKRLSSTLGPSPLEPCANLEALQAMPPLPTDPAIRASLEEHGRADIARIKTLLAAKKYQQALEA